MKEQFGKAKGQVSGTASLGIASEVLVSNLGLWYRNMAVESLLEEELADKVPQ